MAKPTPQAGTAPQLLRAEEVAKRLGLSRQHVYVMAANGELPSIKLRGAVRFDPKDVEAYIEAHRRRKAANE